MTVYVLEKCWIYPAGGFDLQVWEIVSISQNLPSLKGDHEWSPTLQRGEGSGLGRTEWRIREFPVK